MKIKFVLQIICIFLLISTNSYTKQSVNIKSTKKIKLISKNNVKTKYHSIANVPLTVIVFLSDICPISIYNFKNLNDIQTKYSKDSLRIIGVFPNQDMNVHKLNSIDSTYRLKFDICLDKNKKLTKYLGAKITPQVFVVNDNFDILYSGMIDDAFINIKDRKWSNINNYLLETTELYFNKQPIIINSTEPIGCFIY